MEKRWRDQLSVPSGHRGRARNIPGPFRIKAVGRHEGNACALLLGRKRKAKVISGSVIPTGNAVTVSREGPSPWPEAPDHTVEKSPGTLSPTLPLTGPTDLKEDCLKYRPPSSEALDPQHPPLSGPPRMFRRRIWS